MKMLKTCSLSCLFVFVNIVGWPCSLLFCHIAESIQVKRKLVTKVFSFELKLTLSYKKIIDEKLSLSVSFCINLSSPLNIQLSLSFVTTVLKYCMELFSEGT